MPAYDFRCTACDTVFEISRRAGSVDAVCCPQCDSDATKRVFTPVGVVFKGSGFHTTDYRKKPAAESVPEPACPSASGDSASCASCPAAKPADTTSSDAS
ncbi:MAG: zinc ribbon domain-containing protein [Actinomycetota bacterium]|nr:zinc ribbon domain-containing protein [Actinomycetota bacterium]